MEKMFTYVMRSWHMCGAGVRASEMGEVLTEPQHMPYWKMEAYDWQFGMALCSETGCQLDCLSYC